MSDSNWLSEFPEMDRSDLRAIRKTLDGAYRDFSREYGDLIESFFDPRLSFLVWFEKLLISTPWMIILGVCTALVYAASRSWKLAVACFVSLILIGYFGMWEDTMRTLSIITVCTMLAIALGIPIARSEAEVVWTDLPLGQLAGNEMQQHRVWAGRVVSVIWLAGEPDCEESGTSGFRGCSADRADQHSCRIVIHVGDINIAGVLGVVSGVAGNGGSQHYAEGLVAIGEIVVDSGDDHRLRSIPIGRSEGE